MKNEDLTKITNAIQEKLGKEHSGTIADDLGKIISDNTNTNKIIEQKDKEIEKLKSTNEMLAIANGQLLQQVGMGEDPEDDKKTNENEPKVINFLDSFDGKGGFKR